MLGGVGFTMAIFVANLAYDSDASIVAAKAAILAASTVAGVAGFLLLLKEARSDAQRGVLYVSNPGEDDNLSVADAETRRESSELMECFEESDCAELREAMRANAQHEVAVCVDAEAYRARRRRVEDIGRNGAKK